MKEVTPKEINYWIASILIPIIWVPLGWFVKELFGFEIVIAISSVLLLLLLPAYSTILAVIFMTVSVKYNDVRLIPLKVAEFCSYFSITLDKIFGIIPGNPFCYGRVSHCYVLVTLLQENEEIDASAPIIEETIKTIESDYGKDSAALIGWLANLAHCQEHQGKFDESIKTINRLLELGEKYGEEVDYTISTSLISLCMVFSKRGRIKEAEELGLKALNMLQQMDSLSVDESSSNVLVGVAMNNLACVYDDICKYDESKKLYNRALKIKSMAESPDHPSLGAAHCNISGSLVIHEDYEKALEHGETAMEILDCAGKKDTAMWAATLENIGAAHLGLKDYEKAESELNEALKMKLNSYPENDPAIASTYRELGKLYRETDQVKLSDESFSKSLSIYEGCMGKEHPKVIETLKEIAKFYERTNQVDKLNEVNGRIDNFSQSSQ